MKTFKTDHPTFGEVEITVTHYLNDTTRVREDGNPMEIEFTVTPDYDLADEWVEQEYLDVLAFDGELVA
jgi:hypothetical protein